MIDDQECQVFSTEHTRYQDVTLYEGLGISLTESKQAINVYQVIRIRRKNGCKSTDQEIEYHYYLIVIAAFPTSTSNRTPLFAEPIVAVPIVRESQVQSNSNP